ncbi:hypothetical protein FHW22_001082|nr:hypothetical protein [Enterobacter ludwigii]
MLVIFFTAILKAAMKQQQLKDMSVTPRNGAHNM